MISVRTVSDRTTPTMGVISTRAIVFRLRRLLQRTTYTRPEQVEKELETGLSRSKIGIFHFSAGVAQLVEHFLAKEDVASSSLVTRFFFLSFKHLVFKDLSLKDSNPLGQIKRHLN